MKRQGGGSPRLISVLSGHQALTLSRIGEVHSSCDVPAGAVVHDHGSVMFCVGGEASVWAGCVYRVEAGDVLVLPEGMPHYTFASEGCTGWGMALCTSCMSGGWGEGMRRVFEGIREGESAVRRLERGRRREVERYLEVLASELLGRRNALAIEGWMGVLVAEVEASSLAAQTLPKGVMPLAARALTYIEAHATRGISLSDVARAVGRAPAHLATVMKRETGRTVVEWITHTRMMQARQLLIGSDDTIESVAGRVGFESASHFHRTFRRLHGASPGAWRTHHREPGVSGAAQE